LNHWSFDGPVVYDIHFSKGAFREEMRELLKLALGVLKPEQLWVNPDCGLKRLNWLEAVPALENMSGAASELRVPLSA
jgi:5-methyltetrahydropteroyltriglutamate--homocysteine methyltransferase